MFKKQQQKAGDSSQQFQAEQMTVVTGIDEKRAREIVDEKLGETIKNYSLESQKIAEERIQLFADDLTPKLVKNSLLNGLKEPSVQMLLLDAQKTAASTERATDYSLLSELLIHRVKKGDDRNIRAGISRAVEIVDEITDEALLGLTVAHSVVSFMPALGEIGKGISILNDLFSKLLDDDIFSLPKGYDWLDHLDILNTIRVSHLGNMKKLNQYYSEQLSGYVDVGIKKDSENYTKAHELLQQVDLPSTATLVEHELRLGYVRLPLVNKDNIDSLSLTKNQVIINSGQVLTIPVNQELNRKQKDTLNEIYELYENNQQLKNENITKFIEIWDSYDSLKKVHDWWDNLPQSFTITAAGKVLAHVNAQRCDPSLPPLN